MAVTIAKASLKLEADLSGLTQGLRQADNQVKQFAARSQTAAVDVTPKIDTGMLARTRAGIESVKAALNRITDVPGLRQLKAGFNAVDGAVNSMLQRRYGGFGGKAIKFAGTGLDIAAMSQGLMIPGISLLGSLGAAGVVEAGMLGAKLARPVGAAGRYVGTGLGQLANRQVAGHIVGQAVQGFGNMASQAGFGGLLDAVKALPGPAKVVALAIAGIGIAVHVTAGEIDHLAKKARDLGTTQADLAGLKLAGQFAGVDFGDLETGFTKLNITLGKALQGGAEAGAGFHRLGLDIHQLAAMPFEQKVAAIADALQGVSDPAERAALATEMLGRGGARMLQFFDGGSAGIRAAAEDARQLGVTVSEFDAKGVEHMNDEFTRSKTLLKGFATQTTAAVAPTVGSVMQLLTALGKAAMAVFKPLAQGVKLVLAPIAWVLKTIAKGFEVIVGLVEGLVGLLAKLKDIPILGNIVKAVGWLVGKGGEMLGISGKDKEKEKPLTGPQAELLKMRSEYAAATSITGLTASLEKLTEKMRQTSEEAGHRVRWNDWFDLNGFHNATDAQRTQLSQHLSALQAARTRAVATRGALDTFRTGNIENGVGGFVRGLIRPAPTAEQRAILEANAAAARVGLLSAERALAGFETQLRESQFTDSIDRIQSLGREWLNLRDEIGMTAEEVKLFRLEQTLIASGRPRSQWGPQLEEATQQAAILQGRRLNYELRDPVHTLNLRRAELQNLFDRGTITRETSGLATRQALQRAEQGLGIGGPIQPVQAMLEGSREAIETIARGQMAGIGPQNVQDRIAAINEAGNAQRAELLRLAQEANQHRRSGFAVAFGEF